MAPCKTCRLQPTALPDYYYAKKKFVSTFYLITLLHAYLFYFLPSLGSSLCAFLLPCNIVNSKIDLFSVRTFVTTHKRHYSLHKSYNYIDDREMRPTFY